MVDADVASLGK